MADTPPPRLPVLDIVKAALAASFANFQILALLGIFYLAIMIAATRPFWDLYMTLAALTPGTPPPPEIGPEMLKFYVVFLLVIGPVSYGVGVIWLRVIGLGREAAFDGGARAFFKRLLMVFWRTLCYLGLALASLLPVILLGGLLAALFGGSQATVATVTMTLVSFWLVLFLLLTIGYAVSVVATSMDGELGVLAALRLIRGNWVAAGFVFILLYAPVFLASIIISLASLLAAQGGSLVMGGALVLQLALSFLFYGVAGAAAVLIYRFVSTRRPAS